MKFYDRYGQKNYKVYHINGVERFSGMTGVFFQKLYTNINC